MWDTTCRAVPFVREHTSLVKGRGFWKKWHECLWNLRKSHPVMLTLARSPRAIENHEPLFLCRAQGLTGVVATPKELCLFSVLKSHPMKRNSRVSQHLCNSVMRGSPTFLVARMYVLVELYTYELPLLHI